MEDEEPIITKTKPSATPIAEDADEPHDVYHDLAAAFAGEDVSEPEDDEEFEALYREHVEL